MHGRWGFGRERDLRIVDEPGLRTMTRVGGGGVFGGHEMGISLNAFKSPLSSGSRVVLLPSPFSRHEQDNTGREDLNGA